MSCYKTPARGGRCRLLQRDVTSGDITATSRQVKSQKTGQFRLALKQHRTATDNCTCASSSTTDNCTCVSSSTTDNCTCVLSSTTDNCTCVSSSTEHTGRAESFGGQRINTLQFPPNSDAITAGLQRGTRHTPVTSHPPTFVPRTNPPLTQILISFTALSGTAIITFSPITSAFPRDTLMRISGRGRGGDSTLGDCGQGALDGGQSVVARARPFLSG